MDFYFCERAARDRAEVLGGDRHPEQCGQKRVVRFLTTVWSKLVLITLFEHSVD